MCLLFIRFTYAISWTFYVLLSKYPFGTKKQTLKLCLFKLFLFTKLQFKLLTGTAGDILAIYGVSLGSSLELMTFQLLKQGKPQDKNFFSPSPQVAL